MRLIPTLVLSLVLALAALPLLAAPAAGQSAEADRLWSALAAGGHVAIMRHARTVPGTGDPPNFRIGDCSTQRNLGEEGRAEARRFGAEWRRRGLPAPAAILSSEWCRCVDTATLFALGPVETRAAALNSFFGNRAQEAAATRALRDLLAGLPRGGPPVVLVTHQVNITALTGIVPAQGEAVVLRLDGPGGFTVVGRLSPP